MLIEQWCREREDKQKKNSLRTKLAIEKIDDIVKKDTNTHFVFYKNISFRTSFSEVQVKLLRGLATDLPKEEVEYRNSFTVHRFYRYQVEINLSICYFCKGK